MNTAEMELLEKSIDEMTEIAITNGLDFYPMRFEVCPADVLYTFGAYGMPTRFSHWSFGKADDRALCKDGHSGSYRDTKRYTYRHLV